MLWWLNYLGLYSIICRLGCNCVIWYWHWRLFILSNICICYLRFKGLNIRNNWLWFSYWLWLKYWLWIDGIIRVINLFCKIFWLFLLSNGCWIDWWWISILLSCLRYYCRLNKTWFYWLRGNNLASYNCCIDSRNRNRLRIYKGLLGFSNWNRINWNLRFLDNWNRNLYRHRVNYWFSRHRVYNLFSRSFRFSL